MDYYLYLFKAMVIPLSALISLGFSCLIILTCYSGDWLLLHVSATYPDNIYLRAMVDSSTHAAIGGLSWAIVESDKLLVNFQSWMNCLACAFLSALVDIDHFVAAGSLDVKKAVSLHHRPAFHNTSLIVAIVLLCWSLKSYVPSLVLFSLMFVCAWFSHHLRDANHRGLWFYPLGHTPVFSFTLYVSCIITLAVSIKFLSTYALFRSRRNILPDDNVV